MVDREQILHAAQATRVVSAPRRELETFGETAVRYYCLSDLLDAVDQVRIRKGRVTAARPKVITPHYFVTQALENFGEEAQSYVEHLLASSEGVRILEYGLHFRKEEHSEEVVQGQIDDIAEQVCRDTDRDTGELCGVLIGIDDLWEVSLLKFMGDLIRGSAPRNLREMAGRGLLNPTSGDVPNAVRIELESDLRAAAGSRDRLQALAVKLRQYGLFQEYEDRFYGLYRTARP